MRRALVALLSASGAGALVWSLWRMIRKDVLT
jgi:hypothetical protein